MLAAAAAADSCCDLRRVADLGLELLDCSLREDEEGLLLLLLPCLPPPPEESLPLFLREPCRSCPMIVEFVLPVYVAPLVFTNLRSWGLLYCCFVTRASTNKVLLSLNS